MSTKVYKLKNGFWINAKGNLFDLCLNDEIVVANCVNFSYVANKFIAIKKNDTIKLFSLKPIKNSQKYIPEELSCFSNMKSNIFVNIVIDSTCYTIDHNCQVTVTQIKNKLYPKLN